MIRENWVSVPVLMYFALSYAMLGDISLTAQAGTGRTAGRGSGLINNY